MVCHSILCTTSTFPRLYRESQHRVDSYMELSVLLRIHNTALSRLVLLASILGSLHFQGWRPGQPACFRRRLPSCNSSVLVCNRSRSILAISRMFRGLAYMRNLDWTYSLGGCADSIRYFHGLFLSFSVFWGYSLLFWRYPRTFFALS